MIAVLHLVPPSDRDDADPRDPDVFRGGLASARAALRDGVTRRHRPRPDPAAGRPAGTDPDA